MLIEIYHIFLQRTFLTHSMNKSQVQRYSLKKEYMKRYDHPNFAFAFALHYNFAFRNCTNQKNQPKIKISFTKFKRYCRNSSMLIINSRIWQDMIDISALNRKLQWHLKNERKITVSKLKFCLVYITCFTINFCARLLISYSSIKVRY